MGYNSVFALICNGKSCYVSTYLKKIPTLFDERKRTDSTEHVLEKDQKLESSFAI